MKTRAASQNRTATCLILGLAIAGVGLRAPVVHAAAPGATEPSESSVLEVTVDPAMSRGDLIRSWVYERGLQVFARRPTALEEGDRIVVELGGRSRDYRVTIRLLRHGRELAEQPPPILCPGASDELLGLVETAIDDAVDRLVAAHQAEQVERYHFAEERSERHSTAQKEAERQRRQEAFATERYRPAGLGITGAVALTLGGGLVAGGAVLTARVQLESHNDLLGPIDLRTPGIALLGIGATVIVAGFGMLIADVVRCNADRVACGERRARRTAWRVDPRGVSLRW